MVPRAGIHFDPAILKAFLPLGAGLHAAMGNQEVETLKPLLETQRRKYFGA
jgi:hypothetical protein